jgi:hypothetical protein
MHVVKCNSTGPTFCVQLRPCEYLPLSWVSVRWPAALQLAWMLRPPIPRVAGRLMPWQQLGHVLAAEGRRLQ